MSIRVDVNLKADGQKLNVIGLKELVANSVNVYYANFEFTEEWEGVGKTAVFSLNEEETYQEIVDAYGSARIPYEMFKESGSLRIGVFGTKGDIVYPTMWSGNIPVFVGADVEGALSQTPTQSEYARIVELLEEGKYFKQKPWTLKGRLTTENKDSGVNVNLEGCREVILSGTIVATSTTNLRVNDYSFMSNFTTKGTRTHYILLTDDDFGFLTARVAKYTSGASPSTLSSTGSGDAIPNLPVSSIRSFSFLSPYYVTECNIEVYAR